MAGDDSPAMFFPCFQRGHAVRSAVVKLEMLEMLEMLEISAETMYTSLA